MEIVIITSLVFIVLGFSGYLVLVRAHRQEMDELASDCSQRLQTVNRDLVLVCTEPESEIAKEIILLHRLNSAAQEMLEQTNSRTD